MEFGQIQSFQSYQVKNYPANVSITGVVQPVFEKRQIEKSPLYDLFASFDLFLSIPSGGIDQVNIGNVNQNIFNQIY